MLFRSPGYSDLISVRKSSYVLPGENIVRVSQRSAMLMGMYQTTHCLRDWSSTTPQRSKRVSMSWKNRRRVRGWVGSKSGAVAWPRAGIAGMFAAGRWGAGSGVASAMNELGNRGVSGERGYEGERGLRAGVKGDLESTGSSANWSSCNQKSV